MTVAAVLRGLARILVVLAVSTGSARSDEVIVFAAASLQTALDALAPAFSAATGHTPLISYAGSSALARQIEQGAPAEVFISADLDWMDYLGERGLVLSNSRRNLLGNDIVLVAPAGTVPPTAVDATLDLPALLGADGHLAMADPDAVPAGRYGRAALESLGLWGAVAHRVAAAENVRAALILVSRGEAPLGIVYATDARADTGVEVVGTFPADTHPPIVYPAALTAEATGDAPQAFLDFLSGLAAGAIFEAEGFTRLD